MKIQFIPLYNYLSLPDFRTAISALPGENQCELIVISDNPENYKQPVVESEFISSYDKIKKFDYARWVGKQKRLKLKDLFLNPRKVFRKKLLRYKIFLKFIKFLKSEKPDLLVATSDLGHFYIRLYISAAELLNVPILILYTCDINEQFSKDNRERKLNFPFKLTFTEYLKARFFDGQIVGTFCRSSYLAVISEKVKEILLRNGVKENRISIISKPVAAGSDVENSLRALLKISEDSKVVIFFTECIQTIFGEQYAKDVHTYLNMCFKKLYENLDVKFIIKPHPRDILLPEYSSIVKNVFTGKHIEIIEDISSDKLIMISDLNLGHFSKVLIDACIKGKPILSLNFKNDRSQTFIPQEVSTVIEVQNEDMLFPRLQKILNDRKEYEKVCRYSDIIKGVYCSEDSLEISEIILNIFDRSKKD